MPEYTVRGMPNFYQKKKDDAEDEERKEMDAENTRILDEFRIWYKRRNKYKWRKYRKQNRILEQD